MPQPDWTYETERGYLVEFGCDHIEPLYTHPSADLRAELEQYKELARTACLGSQEEQDKRLAAEAERDSLRALLWNCRDALDEIDRQPHMETASRLIERIDALSKERHE
jgi:hypothetical protein